jgi:hypothetical protein
LSKADLSLFTDGKDVKRGMCEARRLTCLKSAKSRLMALHRLGLIQVVLAAIERAFDATWPVIRAHEAGANKARMRELSRALSHKLIELASEGVTDPQELRKLALEAFPLESKPS